MIERKYISHTNYYALMESIFKENNVYMYKNEDEKKIFKERLYILYSLLERRNKQFNLTAIDKPEDVILLHFVDSLSLMPFLEGNWESPHPTCVDVGCGAGFPSLPLAAVLPGIRFTAMDANLKKLRFLIEAAALMELDNIKILHTRAETAGRRILVKKPKKPTAQAHQPAGEKHRFREHFDFAVSRAVAPLDSLCEYCLPLIKPGGVFFAMKGKNAKAEAESAVRASHELGGSAPEVFPIRLWNRGEPIERAIVKIKKIAHTDEKYPRNNAKIQNNPL